ncbi:MAG: uracil phosphoribosyltransferase [Proteobacteria bacterium]|nr:uracil phosphoribosyltransferase [Pseudomonadota bacterium]
MAGQIRVIDHPVIQHKLTDMRRRDTRSDDFRRLLREISMLMAYEVMRDWPLDTVEIETPITRMRAPVLAGKEPCLVSILRAGAGILDGMLEVLPSARVGHIGLYREPTTLTAVEYYCKLPEDLAQREAVILDPMLATGHSAIAATSRVKESGAATVKFVCLLASPEGVAAFHEAHPDVPVFTAAVDSHLNSHGYIVPGLGDAGDRLFGTK